MFRDEHLWEDSASAVISNSTLLIHGNVNQDRDAFFPSQFERHSSALRLQLKFRTPDRFEATLQRPGQATPYTGFILSDLITLLKTLPLSFVSMDITSLQHGAIMYVTSLLCQLPAGHLVSLYVEPASYTPSSDPEGYELTTRFEGFSSVPGFARLAGTTPNLLLAFLGFEGRRIAQLLEEYQDVDQLIPILGVPGMRPGWNLVSLANCGPTLASQGAFNDIERCPAWSVFEGFKVLRRAMFLELGARKRNIVVAPLGTRPHTQATALFATQFPTVRVAYDHPIEHTERSRGVGRAHVYHLSGLLP